MVGLSWRTMARMPLDQFSRVSLTNRGQYSAAPSGLNSAQKSKLLVAYVTTSSPPLADSSGCALAAYTNGFVPFDSGGVYASTGALHGPVIAGATRTAMVDAPKPRLATWIHRFVRASKWMEHSA